jgi:hypothetical protein
MKPAEHFREMVEPTIAEFEAIPTSVRHAYLACIVAYHFADTVGVYTGRKTLAELKKIREELADFTPAFWVVEGIANMAKHIELTRPHRVHTKIVDTHVGLEAAFPDGTFLLDDDGSSTSWKDSPDVVRTIDNHGRPVSLLWCVREVRRAIETYLTRPDMQ